MLRADESFVEPEAGRDRLRIISRSLQAEARHAGHIDRPGFDADARGHGHGLCIFNHACHRDDSDVGCSFTFATGFVGPVG